MFPYDSLEQEVESAKSLEQSATALAHLLSSGVAVWEDGSLYSVRHLVGSVKGLKIEVFAREHPPPHFHISGGDINAIFSLTTCEHLKGNISGRELSLIKWWYEKSRPNLISAWNQTRPSDCPVGPIKE
jgi:hypothetical protein